MRYFWLIDQNKEKLISVRWKPSERNLANYFTKHFFGPYHKKVWPLYLHKENSPKHITHIPNPNKFEPSNHRMAARV